MSCMFLSSSWQGSVIPDSTPQVLGSLSSGRQGIATQNHRSCRSLSRGRQGAPRRHQRSYVFLCSSRQKAFCAEMTTQPRRSLSSLQGVVGSEMTPQGLRLPEQWQTRDLRGFLNESTGPTGP